MIARKLAEIESPLFWKDIVSDHDKFTSCRHFPFLSTCRFRTWFSSCHGFDQPLKFLMAVTIKDPHVAFVFHEYPLAYRRKLLQLRKLILKTSKELGQIQDLVETLKWGEPSYASRKRNIGTTVRIHWLKSKPDQYGIYFYCQTKMIAKCKKKFGNKFNYEGNRALIFKKDDKLPLKELKECIRMAFTYYLEKN